MRRTTAVLTVLAAAAVAAIARPGPAAAAPQVLAALPSPTGLALVCRDGTCQADLSTYCLQRSRPAPKWGHAYVPARPEHFTLVLVDAAGAETRLPAHRHLRFTESRGFMAVAATVPAARLGAVSARVVVAEQASLIPVPKVDDPDPLTEKEIAYATGSLRQQGAKSIDGRPEADAAGMLARMTNALPADGAVPKGGFDDLWREAIGDELPLPAAGPALSRARLEYDRCEGRPGTYTYGGLRRCLEYRHDDLIRDLNIDYWQNQPGS